MAEAAWEEANRPRGWGGWFAVPSDTDGSVKITHNNYIHSIC